MSSSKSREQIWDEWRELVNMTPSELDDWLDTEESRSVGDNDGSESTGHRSGRRIKTILDTRKEEISSDQWDHMAEVVGYIKRHCSPGGPDSDVEESAWRYSLMNSGHDPLKDDGCGA